MTEDTEDTEDTADAEKRPESAGDDQEAPLDELAREMRERSAKRENGEANERAAVFEQVDVGSIDRERLWEDLLNGEASGDDTEDVGSSGALVSVESTDRTDAESATEVESETEIPAHVVSKREYCQRCPHFSAPPDATCTNEGTDIVEVVSVDEFRVRNCPKVDDSGLDAE